MTETTVPRMPDVMRRVNDLICESLDDGAQAEPVAFFCECSDDACYRPVWLAPDAYRRSRREPYWTALAAGHLAVPVAQRPWAFLA